MKDNIAELRKIFGDRILEKKEDLVPYMKDASYFEGNIPMAAIIPKNSEEISKLMKICSREKIQVVMRSGGSALTGSPVPNGDSILISMSAMNKILETHLDDGYIVAEPGLRLDDLNNYLPISSGMGQILRYAFVIIASVPSFPAISAVIS